MKDKMTALLHAANAICSSMQLNEILDILIREINMVVEETDVIFIFLYDNERNLLLPHSAYGIDLEAFRQMEMHPGESIAGQVFSSCQSMLCSDSVKQAMCSMSQKNLEAFLRAVPDAKYPESAICAPMVYRNECLGVLTIDRFVVGKPYTINDVKLLESIASLAAIAIANARMYSQVTDNWKQMSELNAIITATSEKLNHSIEINKALAIASLKGQGIQKICETLSEIMGYPIAILDEFGELLASSVEQAHELFYCLPSVQDLLWQGNNSPEELLKVLPGDEFYFAPISDGTLSIGYMIITGFAKDNFYLIERVCEMASLLLAIEILRVERERQIKENFIGNSLRELLDGKNNEDMLKRLKAVSPNISRSRYMISIVHLKASSEGETLISLRHNRRSIVKYIKARIPECIYMIKDERIVIMYPFTYNTSDAKAYELVEKINEGVLGLFPKNAAGPQIRIGCGQIVDGIAGLPRSLSDADVSIQYLETINLQKSTQFFHELGMRKLLFRNTGEELYRFYLDTLGPVLQYDTENNACLMQTLYAMKRCGRSPKECATTLNIHKNTLSYRLKKVRDLLCLEDSGELMQQEIQFALEIGEYLEETKFADKKLNHF